MKSAGEEAPAVAAAEASGDQTSERPDCATRAALARKREAAPVETSLTPGQRARLVGHPRQLELPLSARGTP